METVLKEHTSSVDAYTASDLLGFGLDSRRDNLTENKEGTNYTVGETGVKSNTKCISDFVAKGKQPMQLFRGSFRTSMLWLFGKSECFRMKRCLRVDFLV